MVRVFVMSVVVLFGTGSMAQAQDARGANADSAGEFSSLERSTLRLSRLLRSHLAEARRVSPERAACLDRTLSQVHGLLRQLRQRSAATDDPVIRRHRQRVLRVYREQVSALRAGGAHCLGTETQMVRDGTEVVVEIDSSTPRDEPIRRARPRARRSLPFVPPPGA